MTRYACVGDQKAAGFPVTAACEAVEVSTSGYYADANEKLPGRPWRSSPKRTWWR